MRSYLVITWPILTARLAGGYLPIVEMTYREGGESYRQGT